MKLSGELGKGKGVSSQHQKEMALVKEMQAKGIDPYKNHVHIV